jgi:hypothetical protein
MSGRIITKVIDAVVADPRATLSSSDAPQRVDEYFLRVLHPLSQAVQHFCAMCSAGMWTDSDYQLTVCALIFVRNSSSTMQIHVQLKDEHKMRTSSLGPRSKLLYVMIEEPRW